MAFLVGACTSSGSPAVRASASSASYAPGAPGAGDPYFPTYGNGGYDVAGYDLNLRYEPKKGYLSGTATIAATATQDLSRFDFDLARLKVSAVTVDGRKATAAADGNELVVTPAAGIRNGTAFTVVVTYAGTPGQLANETLGDGGWLRSDTGAVALGQPESASTWFPVNDHPSDKATFKLAMTVPDGLEALSIGVPGPRTSAGGWTTWRWTESSPLASYLSTVIIGQYRVTTGTHAGKPMVTAVPESVAADSAEAKSLARTGEITDFLATKFGPYPFDSYGGIVVEDARIRYALETQSRPAYGRAFFSGGENDTVVAHELAHQWFGDSVALEKWQDIWLNEGFATYAEWLWQEHDLDVPLKDSFDRTYRSFDWAQAPGNPGVAHLFGSAVYDRGGMTVYALRKTIGDKAFAKLLTTWTSQHRNGNANTADLIALAEKVSGKNLDAFFQAWLYGTKKPTY
ncbi:aminopeptidase N [Actinoplanes tereljensis]|uniref:Aminopeptidase N n=1 Tax=Paractinoplanes tereljensis TaxID=571912 RepID=A0A919NJL5_9ACTN|nr:peptidase [Actinoplanes tereljensis]